ncbi:MAG: outer membrane protein transport protein [Verrucomicrobia bacterium]|nr:outer membrane protein transport protein [Verrucomicrobiota bacterium]
MHHRRRLSLQDAILLSLGGLTALPAAMFGLGFRIPNQDAEAQARGNAFIATANNPSALYYNPAGITQLEGAQAQIGFHVISVNSHFDGLAAGVEEDTKFEIQPVPQFYYTLSPKGRAFSFGLGMYAPFGLGLEWPEDASFRNLAREGRLQYLTVSPIVAWQVHPKLSIAAGPTVNYSQAMLRRGIGVAPGDEFRFRGNGHDFGAKAGLLWQPCEQWSVGVSYFSPTTINYRGRSSAKPLVPGKNGTSAELDFPQFVMAGISFRPNPDWNIEVAVDWTDWDTLDTVMFKGTAFGDVPFAMNWESSYLAHLGVSRYLRGGYWVAAGYFFSQNSTSDRDFNPIVPDTDLHVGSLGFGHRGERWSWAISGQIITGPARSISNGTAADGSYQFFNQAVNFSFAYHF